MKNHSLTRYVGASILVSFLAHAHACEAPAKPEEGKDWVAVPTVGDGQGPKPCRPHQLAGAEADPLPQRMGA